MKILWLLLVILFPLHASEKSAALKREAEKTFLEQTLPHITKRRLQLIESLQACLTKSSFTKIREAIAGNTEDCTAYIHHLKSLEVKEEIVLERLLSLSHYDNNGTKKSAD